MDIKGYLPEDGEEQDAPKPVRAEKNKSEAPSGPKRMPMTGVQRAASLVPQDRPNLDKASDFVTKKQVYEILRKNSRVNSEAFPDIGEQNRQAYAEYRKREMQTSQIEEQARQRRMQAEVEKRRARGA